MFGEVAREKPEEKVIILWTSPIFSQICQELRFDPLHTKKDVNVLDICNLP